LLLSITIDLDKAWSLAVGPWPTKIGERGFVTEKDLAHPAPL
jgi:hypothetical protein